MIGPRDGSHDHVDMIEQPGAPARQMQMGAHIEDNKAAVGVGCTRMLVSHGLRP
jgi:hypothetical protein